MHVDWSAVWRLAVSQRLAILSLGGLVVSSGVKTLPVPGQPFSLYTWLYDWSHQFLNVTNTRLVKGPVVTPPEPAESPKV